ncbi:hypothetical protein [Rhodobacter lacus]|uniref:Uncharacterized protein n=1 Tax=Rhodobacter lacus TaxID=1641972 RepID=A0ABW5A493_9RHOB
MPSTLTPPLPPSLGLPRAPAQSARHHSLSSPLPPAIDAEAEAEDTQGDTGKAWPGGWWILPALPLGAAFWGGLLVLLL